MIYKKSIWGLSKITFLLAAPIYSASKMKFANNSLKSPKLGKLNIDTLIIPQGLSINENQKSYATVPLNHKLEQMKGQEYFVLFAWKRFNISTSPVKSDSFALTQFQRIYLF